MVNISEKLRNTIYKRLTSSFLERPELKPIIEYLETRYKDSTGIRETLWRIKEKNYTRYSSIIEGWTVIDPMKRQVAQENHLKYLELFDSKISFEEFKNLISNIDRKYNLDKNESFN